MLQAGDLESLRQLHQSGPHLMEGVPEGSRDLTRKHIPQPSVEGGVKGAVRLREAGPFRGLPLHTAHQSREFK